MINKIFVPVLIAGAFLLFINPEASGEKNAKTFKIFLNEAKTKYAAGNLIGAVSAGEKAMESDPENRKGRKFLLRALVELGTECARNEDWQNALLYLDKARKLVPKDRDVNEMYSLVRDMRNSSYSMYETETGMPGLEQICQGGNYRAAYEKMRKLGAEKSKDIEVRDLYKKLKMVSMTIPEIKGADEKSEFLKKAIGYYLSEEPKGAINMLQYYTEKNPDDRESSSIMRSVKAEYPDVAKEESVADGMTFVESKLFRALNYIYENKHDLAVNECNAVLDIEPDNLTALLRLGSAYYVLGMKERAKEAYTRAREIDSTIDEGLGDWEVEKGITIEVEEKVSKYESEDQKNFEQSIKYYQDNEKKNDLRWRVITLRRIVDKYKSKGVDVSKIQSILEILRETKIKR